MHTVACPRCMPQIIINMTLYGVYKYKVNPDNSISGTIPLYRALDGTLTDLSHLSDVHP